jgi:hypothetical protein
MIGSFINFGDGVNHRVMAFVAEATCVLGIFTILHN